MFEAEIYFKSGRQSRVEAGSIEMLKTKCRPHLDNEDVYAILCYKKKSIGFFKFPTIEGEDINV